MDVVIAGGHGAIALLLARQLADRGDRVRSLVRNPDHAADIELAGAQPVVADLETDEDLGPHLVGADALVFAAGAGPGSGVARKWTVDRDGAIKLANASKQRGVSRYVLISSMGVTAEPSSGDAEFDVYLRAKWEAEERVSQAGLDLTIIRPGGLTDDDAVGRVRLAERVDRGRVARADVAAVIATCLATDSSIGKIGELVAGDTPISEAVAAL